MIKPILGTTGTAGTTGIWPETKTKPFATIAWAILSRKWINIIKFYYKIKVFYKYIL
jgi:hypothetical protein